MLQAGKGGIRWLLCSNLLTTANHINTYDKAKLEFTCWTLFTLDKHPSKNDVNLLQFS